MARIYEAGGLALAGLLLWGALRGITPLSLDFDLRTKSRVRGLDLDRAFAAVDAPMMISLGTAFSQAEYNHGVNALFLAALAIHESDRGTSRIAQDKNNLFGWGAYDATPYESAYFFRTKQEGIAYVASRIHDLYFTQWRLTTLRGMNTRYSTDREWGNKILVWMRRLENAIRN